MWQQAIKELNEVMTYRQIAEAIGMSVSSVWELEKADSRKPLITTYLRIMDLRRMKDRAINKARKQA